MLNNSSNPKIETSEECRCNIVDCRKLLDSFAWATYCSHIF